MKLNKTALRQRASLTVTERIIRPIGLIITPRPNPDHEPVTLTHITGTDMHRIDIHPDTDGVTIAEAAIALLDDHSLYTWISQFDIHDVAEFRARPRDVMARHGLLHLRGRLDDIPTTLTLPEEDNTIRLTCHPSGLYTP